jgi:hypothetical protein
LRRASIAVRVWTIDLRRRPPLQIGPDKRRGRSTGFAATQASFPFNWESNSMQRVKVRECFGAFIASGTHPAAKCVKIKDML